MRYDDGEVHTHILPKELRIRDLRESPPALISLTLYLSVCVTVSCERLPEVADPI